MFPGRNTPRIRSRAQRSPDPHFPCQTTRGIDASLHVTVRFGKIILEDARFRRGEKREIDTTSIVQG